MDDRTKILIDAFQALIEKRESQKDLKIGQLQEKEETQFQRVHFLLELIFCNHGTDGAINKLREFHIPNNEELKEADIEDMVDAINNFNN